MTATLAPSTLSEFIDAIRSTPSLLPIGAGTKPRLSAVDTVKLSTQKLRGILAYDPGEFTFTALSGTPLRELASALSAQSQYLPFDPPFVDSGATLGGTVAAGLSGPGRFRFGGVRDFVLGIQFIDGRGRSLRMGGKVVKNAAGFDLPKFFVGSLGRFGVLTELTFKVFPRPAASLTLKLPASGIEAATRILIAAANTRWELDALDLLPGGESIAIRLAGPAPALPLLARDILARWPGEILPPADAETLWSDLREYRWTHAGGPLFKIVLTPDVLPVLHQKLRALDSALVHVSAGGNVAFVSLRSPDGAAALDEHLRMLGLPAVALRGNGPLWCGQRRRPKIAQAVKDVLDPDHRFPSLDD